jgi:hypothetical protein
MPEQWLPWHTWVATYLVAALTGVAVAIKPGETPSLWDVVREVLINGAAGCGFGMVGFVWLGGKEHPEKVIGCGFLVALRVIQLGKLREILHKILDSSGGK